MDDHFDQTYRWIHKPSDQVIMMHTDQDRQTRMQLGRQAVVY